MIVESKEGLSLEAEEYTFTANNKFKTLLHRTDFYSQYSWVTVCLRLDLLGNLLEKSAFLASKLGDGCLLVHGPLI